MESSPTPLPEHELPDVLARALDGDAGALDTLVAALAPVVHVRVARALRRRQSEARGRAQRQDCEDLVQDVFATLFDRSAQALRAWDPDRGLGFLSFVGFLAEREVAMRLRSAKRSPWTEEPTEDERLHMVTDHAAMVQDAGRPEAYLESRDLLGRMLDELLTWLTPEGRHYFQLLYVEEKSVAQVAEESGTTTQALYAWRSRLSKKMRKLRDKIATEGPDSEYAG